LIYYLIVGADLIIKDRMILKLIFKKPIR